MKLNSKQIIFFAAALVILGIVGRLLPHAWNFTPVAAISLFAGAYLGMRYAIVVPIVVMFVSDLFVGFYSLPVLLSVYGSFMFIGLLGSVIGKKGKWKIITAGSIVGSTLFFLVTNAAVWFFGTMYSPGIDGLISSYVMGLPFYKAMLMGDLFYTVALFGIYKVVSKTSGAFNSQQVQSVTATSLKI